MHHSEKMHQSENGVYDGSKGDFLMREGVEDEGRNDGASRESIQVPTKYNSINDGVFRMTLNEVESPTKSEQEGLIYSSRESFPKSPTINTSSGTLSSEDSFPLRWNYSDSTSRSPSPYLFPRERQELENYLEDDQSRSTFGSSLHPHAIRSRSLSPVQFSRNHDNYDPSIHERTNKWLPLKPQNARLQQNHSNIHTTHFIFQNYERPTNGEKTEEELSEDYSRIPSSANASINDRMGPRKIGEILKGNNKEIKRGKDLLERERKLYRSKSVSNNSIGNNQIPIEVRSYDSLFKSRLYKKFSFAKFSSKSRSSSRVVSSFSLNEDLCLPSYRMMSLMLYKLQNGKFSARAMFENAALQDAMKIIVEIIGYTLQVTFLDAEDVGCYERSKCDNVLLSKTPTPQKSLSSFKFHAKNYRPKTNAYSKQNQKRYKMTLPIYADTNTLIFSWNKEMNFLEVSGSIKGCSNAFSILEEQTPSRITKKHQKGSKYKKKNSITGTRGSSQRRSSLLDSINCCALNKTKW